MGHTPVRSWSGDLLNTLQKMASCSSWVGHIQHCQEEFSYTNKRKKKSGGGGLNRLPPGSATDLMDYLLYMYLSIYFNVYF